jgi:hypothetical protein
MRARTIVAGVAVAVVVGLAGAGCGGAGSAGSTNLGGAASVAPSDSVAFVAVDSDMSSAQWRAVDDLLQKFPAHDQILTNLQKSFDQHAKVSWATDVKPALGSELDLVALPGSKTQFVGLTQGNDQGKLDALLRKLDKGVVTAQIAGWTAFSTSQAALDTVQAATTKLADNNTYQAAVGKLSADALVRAYANGTEAQQLLSSVGGQDSSGTVPFAWASVEVVASGGGVRVTGYAHDATPGTAAASYTSGLVAEIPSGALLVADVPVTPGQFKASDPSTLPKPLQRLLGSGAAVLPELNDLLGGETAVYVRPGLPLPEVTLVTQPSDTTRAVTALDHVLAALRSAASSSSSGGFDPSTLPVYHDVVGGKLIVSTSQQGIADFRSTGAKLSSDPSFTAAQHASAMPSQTTGFLYVNVASSLPLVELAAPLLGLDLPAALQTDGSALKTLTAFSTRTGDESSFTVFLQVD